MQYNEAFGNKEVLFRFRNRDYNFSLSHGLFSSADIDSGSRFLLKVFSRLLDDEYENKKPLPQKILDAGSGIGVLGICAAGALSSLGAGQLHVRAQDRDELARIFTAINAEKNNVNSNQLSAHTEPLLAGPEGECYDLILTNIPAKAGLPVLEDFVLRSLCLLNPEGKILLVAVNTLSEFFARLIANNAILLKREDGSGHTVFLFGRDAKKNSRSLQNLSTVDFYLKCPAYMRNSSNYEIEKIPYNLDAIHGAQGFDNPGNEIQAAAKLTTKIKKEISCLQAPHNVLIFSEDQGHYPAWLVKYLNNDLNITLVGRNILALSLARHNTAIALSAQTEKIRIISAADLQLDKNRILKRDNPDNRGESSGIQQDQKFNFIAIFPEQVPGTDRIEATWEALADLSLPSAVIIAGFSSSEAERFDRKKTQGFTRLGDIKRKGFRALAYRRN